MTALLCKNPKPDGSWCGIPIEWREIEPGKKRPFEVDTQEQHKCPYWKPDRSKFKVPPDVKAEFEKIERNAQQGTLTTDDVADIKKTLIKLEELCQAILILVQQWPKASEIKK